MNIMKKFVIVTFFIAFFLTLTNASAASTVPDWSTSCYNSTHVYKHKTVYYQNSTSVTKHSWNDTARCPFMCDSTLGVCRQWPANALPGEYFFLLEVIAIILFIIGIWRLDVSDSEMRLFDLLFPILSFILFLTLSIQGNNIIDMTTGTWVRPVFVIWLNYGFALMSLLFTFVALFKHMSGTVET